jgi:pyridoxine 5-phosphate synthase
MNKAIRLNVNVDHIATIRQARRTFEPSVVAAATLAQLAGASGITVHLRGDRRHIQDDDVRTLRAVVTTHLNLEMAATSEMIGIAGAVRPTMATLVPERAGEVTTEGGLDVHNHEASLREAVETLSTAGVPVSIFIDPSVEQIKAAHRIGADQIEICTARYAELTDPTRSVQPNEVDDELARISLAARLAGELGMKVAAGHGLTCANVAAVARVEPVEELNIGHSIVAKAALVGMERAVREMIAAINARLM